MKCTESKDKWDWDWDLECRAKGIISSLALYAIMSKSYGVGAPVMPLSHAGDGLPHKQVMMKFVGEFTWP